MSVIDAIIAKKLCGGGGGSVPEPRAYDYMPEEKQKKAMQTAPAARCALFCTDFTTPSRKANAESYHMDILCRCWWHNHDARQEIGATYKLQNLYV